MYKVIGKFVDIALPDMIEEFGNKEHDSNNVNETNANINNMNEIEGTCPDIVYPDFMVEYKY